MSQSQLKTLEERFWAKVYKRGPDECWLWQASIGSHGYGQLAQGRGFGRCSPPLTTHRLSYELHYGKVPEGMHVLHVCDVRACVNPKHLMLGTHVDNMADMAKKGRSGFKGFKGTAHWMAKLTEAQVIEIRSSTATTASIARNLSMSEAAISHIRRRKTWRHL